MHEWCTDTKRSCDAIGKDKVKILLQLSLLLHDKATLLQREKESERSNGEKEKERDRDRGRLRKR